MKKLLLSFSSILSLCSFAQTAVNFNVNDCSGNNHDLFSELNSGKVVVITWVMPCSSCIGPALSAQNEIQNFSSSHPGQIYHYIADDVANTSCTTLNSWCTTNGINSNARFSNAALNMSDYGTGGMPKTIILAGTGHQVFFNEDNTLTVSNFDAAMNTALAAANAAGIKENSKNISRATISPNPVNNSLSLSYVSTENSNVTIDIYDVAGKKVKTISDSRSIVGANTIKIETSDLGDGVYFLKINNADQKKFVVSH